MKIMGSKLAILAYVIGSFTLNSVLPVIPSTLLRVAGQTKSPSSSESTMQGVTLQRTRVYDTPSLEEPKTVLWHSEKLFTLREASFFSQSGGGLYVYGWVPTGYNFSNPVFADGTIYFSLYVEDGYLFSVDASNGKVKNKLRLRIHSFSPPTIAGDLLFVGGGDGSLMAINRNDFKSRWAVAKKDFRFDPASPIVEDGIVYFGGTQVILGNMTNSRGAGVVAAVDGATGQGRWVFPLKGFPTSAAIAGNGIYFGDEDSHLFDVDRRTGQQTWVFKAENNVGSPAIQGDSAYFVDENNRLYAVNKDTGALKWKTDRSYAAWGAPALYNNTAYLPGKDKDLYAVDGETGKQKWVVKTGSICNSPIVARGVVYFLSFDKYLYAVDANTGEQKWRYKMAHNAFSAPIIVNGIAYLLDEDGYMYAIH
ncbi:MAG TPA: PQQ-binding-like beta-propeller repeat protein [Blastocatellia bacterium]|nr:PQQ-binding-like beta-propeller repeat protein [Blastocatellia bacterium]